MAVTDYAGLTITNPQVGIQITKVTDTSADWNSVPNNTYFYDKSNSLVHYKNSSGAISNMFPSTDYGNIYAQTNFNFLT
jgi:hypothetical protein